MSNYTKFFLEKLNNRCYIENSIIIIRLIIKNFSNMAKKYLTVSQQLEMLKNNQLDELIEYTKEHNLNYNVVRILLNRLKEAVTVQDSTSIH